MKFLKTIFLLSVFGIAGYFGLRTYHYFFDTHKPEVEIAGLAHNGWYADEVQCTLEASDKYKINEVSVWLDGKPLINKFAVNSQKCAHPFSISTRNLPNGKHIIKTEVSNKLYNRQVCTQEMCINVDNSPLQAAFVKNEGDQKVFQGRTLQIQFQVNKPIDSAKVSILSKEYDAFPEDKKSPVYECFVPIKCEEMPNEYPFTVEIKDKVGNVLNLDNKFQVIAFPFQCQTLQVSQEKMEEERKLGEDSDEFKKVIKKLSKESPKKKLWKGAFITPIEITSVTTPFGIIRTTPDKGQYRHKALDVINLPRCIVWAPQNGIVVLKDRYVHSGNTVVIDHGQGVLTLLFHLDSYAHINVGDKIKKGDPVGRMGKTGYAKGYHLHWEMRIGNTAIDPMQWVKGNF